MAAYDDSLFISEGQSWSLWAENIGLRSPNSDTEDEDTKSDQDKTSTCLNRKEMAIYGYCPRWEDFYLVVCNLCGKAIKPQALQQHIDLRHEGESNILKSEIELDFKTSVKSSKSLDHLVSENKFVESVNYKSIINRECNTKDIRVSNRHSDNISTQECDILSRTEEMDTFNVMKMAVKTETIDDSFLGNHTTTTCSLPSRLPPPVPPEPQHILPPPSPHAGPPPSIGPPTPTIGTLPNIGPPTPGRGPPTPIMGPSTPGVGPPTPGIGPPTPGMGPPTPGMGPPTPGMGPPTPGMGPHTPGIGPPTPGLRTPTPGMSPLTPNVGPSNITQVGVLNQVSSIGQQTQNHSQTQNLCPLPPAYLSQSPVQNLGLQNPNLGQLQTVTPMTPTHLQLSPNLDQTVSNLGTHAAQGMTSLTPNLSQQLSLVGNQTVGIDSLSPNMGGQSNQGMVSEHMNHVNITCGRGQSLTPLSQEEIQGAGRVDILQSQSSAEEEVNRISAMLMKEAEELSCQGNSSLRDSGSNNLHSIVANHDIVEAHGLAAGGIHQISNLNNHIAVGSFTPSSSTKVPLTSSNIIQVNSQCVSASQSGSVPIPVSSISMATLKQIQADLLATVSESDLNAVLNITPDTPVLPSNSHCYSSVNSSNNNQFMERGTGNTKHFNSSQINSNNEVISVPVMQQLGSEMLVDTDRSLNVYTSTSSVIPDQYSSSHEHALHLRENVKTSQNDELSRTVNSIANICQENNNNGQAPAESHLSLVSLLQQPPLSETSNLQSNSGTSLNLNQVPSSSQGITFVIGGSHDNTSTPITLTSLANSLKKNPVSTINSNLLTQLTSGSNSSSGSIQGIPISCHDPSQGSQEHFICQSQSSNINQSQKMQTSNLSQSAPILTRTTVQSQQNYASQIANQVTQSQTQFVTNQSISVQQQQGGNHVQLVQSHQQPHQTTPVSVMPPTPSPKKSSKKKKPGERKLLPLKDREYDAEIHCGVLIMDTGKPCTRSLTCKTHSLSLRRAVHGRSKKFDELLIEHKAAKEAQMKASKPPEAASNMVQSTPPRGSVGLNSSNSSGQLNGPSAYVASNVGPLSTSSTSLLVRTLGGGTQTTHVTVPHPDPSPNSTTHYYSMEHTSTSHSQTTSPSAYWPSHRLAPPLSHSDNFFVGESPKPVAVCSYNARRLGGYLATDHKVDTLRSAFANALRKPHVGSNSDNITNTILFNNIERYNNVKPLLARKLQASIPSNPNGNKEGIGVGVGYNGHIQLNSSSGVAIHNSALTASLKRQTHPELLRHNSAVVNTKSKSKKVKSNDSTINYVSNVVQLDASGSKNHFPVVAVSLQNGLTNPQTITFGNVPIAGVRNSSNHPLKLHQPITVRDAQMTDPRTNSGDSANFVLGSGLPSGGFVIDTLKPLKSEGTGSIRLEGSKIISKGITAGSSTGSINIVGSPSALGSGTSTVSTSTLPHQGQVYFTAVSGNNNTQLLQQLLNCRTIGKNTGVKLLGATSQATVTGNRQTFVLQQEKEPS